MGELLKTLLSVFKKPAQIGVVALGLSAATVAGIAYDPIIQKEGNVLNAYQDVVGVWTICGGDTQNVVKGMSLTDSQCRERNLKRITEFAEHVTSKITNDKVTNETAAAHTSFSYNIGKNGYNQSRALSLTNSGDIIGGCKAMCGWVTLTYNGEKVNCAKNRSFRDCNGFVSRREKEVVWCLKGAGVIQKDFKC